MVNARMVREIEEREISRKEAQRTRREFEKPPVRGAAVKHYDIVTRREPGTPINADNTVR
jgi:hypothetical protein